MKDKTRIIVIIIFVLLFILWVFSIYKIIESTQDFQGQKQKCSDIEGCSKYSCLAELSGHVSWKNNYLLQEQNCLLKEGLNER